MNISFFHGIKEKLYKFTCTAFRLQTDITTVERYATHKRWILKCIKSLVLVATAVLGAQCCFHCAVLQRRTQKLQCATATCVYAMYSAFTHVWLRIILYFCFAMYSVLSLQFSVVWFLFVYNFTLTSYTLTLALFIFIYFIRFIYHFCHVLYFHVFYSSTL